MSEPDERGTVLTGGVPHLLGWERHGRQIRFVSLLPVVPCGHTDVVDITGLGAVELELLCNECRTIHRVPRPPQLAAAVSGMPGMPGHASAPESPAASTTAGARGIVDGGQT